VLNTECDRKAISECHAQEFTICTRLSLYNDFWCVKDVNDL